MTKQILFKFWGVYLIAIGIGLLVLGLTILYNNPCHLLIAGFIFLAVGVLIMLFDSTKQNKKGKNDR